MNGYLEFWIFKPNFISLLRILSHLAQYQLDEDEIAGLQYSLTDTSMDQDNWYEYFLPGKQRVGLKMAVDEENRDIIFFRISFPSELLMQMELTVYFVQEFDVIQRHKRPF